MAVPKGVEPSHLDRQSSIIPLDHGTEMVQVERFELPASSKRIQIYSLTHPTVCALLAWRKRRDSNPQYALLERTPVFRTGAMCSSATLPKCWPMSGHQLVVYDLSFFERLETKRPTALCGFVLAEHLGVKPNQPLGCTA